METSDSRFSLLYDSSYANIHICILINVIHITWHFLVIFTSVIRSYLVSNELNTKTQPSVFQPWEIHLCFKDCGRNIWITEDISLFIYIPYLEKSFSIALSQPSQSGCIIFMKPCSHSALEGFFSSHTYSISWGLNDG